MRDYSREYMSTKHRWKCCAAEKLEDVPTQSYCLDVFYCPWHIGKEEYFGIAQTKSYVASVRYNSGPTRIIVEMIYHCFLLYVATLGEHRRKDPIKKLIIMAKS